MGIQKQKIDDSKILGETKHCNVATWTIENATRSIKTHTIHEKQKKKLEQFQPRNVNKWGATKAITALLSWKSHTGIPRMWSWNSMYFLAIFSMKSPRMGARTFSLAKNSEPHRIEHVTSSGAKWTEENVENTKFAAKGSFQMLASAFVETFPGNKKQPPMANLCNLFQQRTPNNQMSYSLTREPKDESSLGKQTCHQKKKIIQTNFQPAAPPRDSTWVRAK